MAGNALGNLFRITTFGESHGGGVGVLIDGVRPNLPIDEKEIQKELDRRRPGQSGLTTPRNEADRVEILSGIFEGKTLGTPICLLIRNRDQRPESYEAIKDLLRPGHAGYTYLSKYGIHDYRGGGRSSGRETAGRVAAGAVAKKILADAGIRVIAYTKEVRGIAARRMNFDEIEKNPVRCPDAKAAASMVRAIERARKEGDSLGGVVEAVVKNCPAGLGDPVFDKLEADLAKALMSIPALKGFEIGSGFAAARMKGSEHNDEFYRDRRTGRIRTRTNNAGGILGGISNGEDIVVRVAVKPPSSIRQSQRTVDIRGKARSISVEGRHDPCICPRVVPVVESMIALVLVDHLMRQSMMRRRGKVASLRNEIDAIDRSLIVLLRQRDDLVREVGTWKRRRKIMIPDPQREREILARRSDDAAEAGLDSAFVKGLFVSIIRHARRIQEAG